MSAIDADVFFVWRSDQKGKAVCQLWHGDKAADGQVIPTLRKHRLSEEQAFLLRNDQLTLAHLAGLYPPPPVAAEPKVKL